MIVLQKYYTANRSYAISCLHINYEQTISHKQHMFKLYPIKHKIIISIVLMNIPHFTLSILSFLIYSQTNSKMNEKLRSLPEAERY